MDKLRWCIVGPGNIAKEFAEDLRFIKNGSQSVVAVVGRNLESAGEFAEEQHVPVIYDELNDFLVEPSADVVYIATPHTLHFDQTLSCLKKGISVLCEKPLGINEFQVGEMIRTARENHTFLLEGMWIRFLPSIRGVLTLIENKTIGELICMKADMSYLAPKDPENRFYNPELGGGSLLDLGIYPVFLSLLLFGKPRSVKTAGRKSGEGVDEACAGLLAYSGGKYAMIESSLVTQTPLEAVIYGTSGNIRILKQWNEKPEGIVVQLNDGTSFTRSCEWEGRGFQFEIEEVHNNLQNGKIESDLFPHQFSINLIRIMDEIRRQLKVKYPFE